MRPVATAAVPAAATTLVHATLLDEAPYHIYILLL